MLAKILPRIIRQPAGTYPSYCDIYLLPETHTAQGQELIGNRPHQMNPDATYCDFRRPMADRSNGRAGEAVVRLIALSSCFVPLLGLREVAFVH